MSVFTRSAASRTTRKLWLPRSPASHEYKTAVAVTLIVGGLVGFADTNKKKTVRRNVAWFSRPLGLDVSKVSCQQAYSESEIFSQSVAYHRSLLGEYRHRWSYGNPENRTPTSTGWPRGVPTKEVIPSLEQDLIYCRRSPNYRSDESYCDNLQFRIAVYYVQQMDDPDIQKKGFKLVKDLAERGHADGMCYYGIILNDGRVAGVDANPNQATVWWRRCVDMYKHVPAVYELAVALYTGEGVAENEALAFHFFRMAADTGHAGAAYMLGDCLLDGIGCQRDRAEALDWLVTAAELGHRGARSRVMAVLEKEEGEDYGKFTDSSRQSLAEDLCQKVDCEEEIGKWIEDDESSSRQVSIERRFTIGGGSRNPVILARRKTVVEESRNA